jgi:hypothetical protein
MLAARRELPGECRGDALALEGVRHGLARKQAAAIDPRSEIGRHGHVGRRGDDARRKLAGAARDLVEQRAEADLGRHFRLDGHRQFIGNLDAMRLSPFARRIPLLEQAGVIKGYKAVIDQNKVGLPISAFASVRLERQSEEYLERFSQAVTAWPEVVDC